MRLSFWLSTSEPSGGAKVFREHARRLAARGHGISLAVGAPHPVLPPGLDALVVTRYRDVLPALERAPRVVHLIQGLDRAEGGPLARWRKERRVARALAAGTRKLVVSKHLLARVPGSLLAPTGVDLAVYTSGDAARGRRVLLSGLGPTKRIELAHEALRSVRDKEVVHLTPHARLEDAAVAALLRATSVYLSTVSEEEGFDLVALEAMASGVACVLSGGGAHEELCPALVVGPDPAALGQAVARTLDDPEERARRVTAGVDAARQRSWDTVFPAVEEAYSRAAR